MADGCLREVITIPKSSRKATCSVQMFWTIASHHCIGSLGQIGVELPNISFKATNECIKQGWVTCSLHIALGFILKTSNPFMDSFSKRLWAKGKRGYEKVIESAKDRFCSQSSAHFIYTRYVSFAWWTGEKLVSSYISVTYACTLNVQMCLYRCESHCVWYIAQQLQTSETVSFYFGLQKTLAATSQHISLSLESWTLGFSSWTASSNIHMCVI